jgi:hypothetical protein
MFKSGELNSLDAPSDVLYQIEARRIVCNRINTGLRPGVDLLDNNEILELRAGSDVRCKLLRVLVFGAAMLAG